jgi:hypothetical protein
MQSKSFDDDYFIKNAILCWLHYFGNDHKWSDIYKELATRDTFTTATTRTQRRTRKPKNVKEANT